MRTSVVIGVIFLSVFMFQTIPTFAQNKVVVVPLFKDYPSTRFPAPVAKTGQKTSYASGDDGDLEKGAVWPNPRFTDNGNGTVTDRLTGLIWLKNASCNNLAETDDIGRGSWLTALSAANSLSHGTCGLADYSSAGDWRLPNIRELLSLVQYRFYDPPLPNTAGTGKWSEGDPFSGVTLSTYWSSTTYANNTNNALAVYMTDGFVTYIGKSISIFVWPVRDSN